VSALPHPNPLPEGEGMKTYPREQRERGWKTATARHAC
jgi:hypothetical protein